MWVRSSAISWAMACFGLAACLSGCYSARERPRDGGPQTDQGPLEDDLGPLDAGPPCAPDGVYDTVGRVEVSDPVGCAGSSEPAVIGVTFPFDDYLSIEGCEAGSYSELTPVGACEWSIRFHCEGLPSVTDTQGVLRLDDGGVSGRLEHSLASDFDNCEWTVLLGDEAEP